MPMLKAFSASSDVVVASTGTPNLLTEASDSPSLARRLAAALPSVFSTSCLVAASSCSLASVSPVLQPTASKPITYCPPKLEIDPSTIALLPVRTHDCGNGNQNHPSAARRLLRRNMPPGRSRCFLFTAGGPASDGCSRYSFYLRLLLYYSRHCCPARLRLPLQTLQIGSHFGGHL